MVIDKRLVEGAPTDADVFRGDDECRVSSAQTRLSLLFLILSSVVFFTGAFLTHQKSAFANIEATRRQFFVERDIPYNSKGRFCRPGCAMFLDKVPFVDFSRGIYLLGSSNTLNAFKDWEVDELNGAPITNLAVGGASHSDQLLLLKYLRENKGLFSMQDETNLVVFGLFYTNAHHRADGILADSFANQSERYGLFRYERPDGLEEVTTQPLYRRFKLERFRIANLMQTLWMDTAVGWNPILSIVPPLPSKARVHTPEKYQKSWKQMMGADWEENMQVELVVLGETLDYLEALSVGAVGVLLPSPSWHRQMPHHARYLSGVQRVFGEHAEPLFDLSTLLSDEEFRDHTHMGYDGASHCHDKLLEFMQDATGVN